VISELVKKKPNPRVTQWIRNEDEADLFLSVITIGEIQKGISKLPGGHKNDQELNQKTFHS
jgi:predicted nucleic acid-binding protein